MVRVVMGEQSLGSYRCVLPVPPPQGASLSPHQTTTVCFIIFIVNFELLDVNVNVFLIKQAVVDVFMLLCSK